MDKFTETYLKIIAEENGFEVPAEASENNQKYNVTILYGIGGEDLDGVVDFDSEDYGEAEIEKCENQAVETLKKAFAPFGGICTAKEDGPYDVAYYLGDHDNHGSNGYPFEFKGVTKDQLVQIFNVEAPYKGEMTFGDMIQLDWDGEEWDGQDPDQLIEILNFEWDEQGTSMLLNFEEV